MTAPTSDIQLMDNMEYMRGLPDESMQLIVTSPPYNIGKEYEKKSPLDVYLEGRRFELTVNVKNFTISNKREIS